MLEAVFTTLHILFSLFNHLFQSFPKLPNTYRSKLYKGADMIILVKIQSYFHPRLRVKECGANQFEFGAYLGPA